MTSRVIALDLDGTLLTPQKTLLPSSLEALKRAQEAGYQLLIVTGRHHVAIHPFYQALGLDTPAICCNGTYLYDYQAKKVLASDPLPVTQALQLIDLLDEHAIHGLMYVDNAMVYERPTGHMIRTATGLCLCRKRSVRCSLRFPPCARRRKTSTQSGNLP
jgi:hydroxymethylpyrimidine pyrophosphatase-like HAD family hydrolase